VASELGETDASYSPQLLLLAEDVSLPERGLDRSAPLGAERGLLLVARALTRSPQWESMPDAAVVVRPSPVPLLGVVGRFDDAARGRLALLSAQLTQKLPRIRYVDYERAERDCAVLAERLVETFGREEVERFSYLPIPRGGLIVLGMLAYVLGLKSHQLTGSTKSGVPVVIVDDCSLTGHRFGCVLREVESDRVVFASLYSPPPLRTAIEARESRVMACLSANDLEDSAPETYGDEYPRWLERSLERMEAPRYWLGRTEYLAFAWTEPDSSALNPVTGERDIGWRLLPADYSLRRRGMDEASEVPMQMAVDGPGPLNPAARILWGEIGEDVLVLDVDAKSNVCLTGVAGDMWRRIREHGDIEDAAAVLAAEYDAEPATIRRDLQAFVDELLERGILRRD
jgi:hypothetical protein